MKLLEPLDKRNGIYEISPEDAQQLVDNGGRNRPVKRSIVAKYALSMKRDKFRITGGNRSFWIQPANSSMVSIAASQRCK